MARLATPPPPPDPRLARARVVRAKAGMIARVYVTLILAAAVGIAMLALVAPWTLVTIVAGIISAALILVGGVAFIARATGGFVSGFGVIYAAMFAALTPSMLMLWRRFRRQRTHIDLMIKPTTDMRPIPNTERAGPPLRAHRAARFTTPFSGAGAQLTRPLETPLHTGIRLRIDRLALANPSHHRERVASRRFSRFERPRLLARRHSVRGGPVTHQRLRERRTSATDRNPSLR